ncbi:hypothetical protein M758_7G055600 [Ceratodon purpureus]|uniref:Uncharacterized protein n=1 Tax=Ceratodon purpureus TaxID=3225 RepID=A0A8T0HB74_CERPU|nr:hypothetical protein KC19_7G058100 [Ceratodon purpureus]KAG0610309.1 hypothetical protein M758_7G055600 [Ceratodon purpureus]
MNAKMKCTKSLLNPAIPDAAYFCLETSNLSLTNENETSLASHTVQAELHEVYFWLRSCSHLIDNVHLAQLGFAEMSFCWCLALVIQELTLNVTRFVRSAGRGDSGVL